METGNGIVKDDGSDGAGVGPVGIVDGETCVYDDGALGTNVPTTNARRITNNIITGCCGVDDGTLG